MNCPTFYRACPHWHGGHGGGIPGAIYPQSGHHQAPRHCHNGPRCCYRLQGLSGRHPTKKLGPAHRRVFAAFRATFFAGAFREDQALWFFAEPWEGNPAERGTGNDGPASVAPEGDRARCRPDAGKIRQGHHHLPEMRAGEIGIDGDRLPVCLKNKQTKTSG